MLRTMIVLLLTFSFSAFASSLTSVKEGRNTMKYANEIRGLIEAAKKEAEDICEEVTKDYRDCLLEESRSSFKRLKEDYDQNREN